MRSKGQYKGAIQNAGQGPIQGLITSRFRDAKGLGRFGNSLREWGSGSQPDIPRQNRCRGPEAGRLGFPGGQTESDKGSGWLDDRGRIRSGNR